MSGTWLRICALACTIVGPVCAAAATEPALRFVDATADSGIDLRMTSGETPSRFILEVNGGGVAVFDYDGDGDLDLFFANGATVTSPDKGPGSRLFSNRGDGTFVDVTGSSGLSLKRWATGVAVADYDGDGDDDLYVTCYGPNVLLRNDVNQGGKFVDVTSAAGVADPGWGTSAAFGDLDADGDQDLYVANYLEFDVSRPPSREGVMFLGVNVMAGPAGLKPQPDVLYENLGHGKFREVPRAGGCAGERAGYGLGVRVFDMDRDGRLDLFVGNDSTENFLCRNLGELRFEEVGVVSGLASNHDGGNQATMGIALADVDGNGLPDVFTTNFSSDTNTLHLNLGSGGFDDRTSQFGLALVSRPFLSWGAGFYDFDSDGDEDLLVASGHVYPEAATHKMDTSYEQPLLLFERRDSRFRRRADAGDIFSRNYAGRSTGFGDLDGDGDVDVVLVTLNDAVRLFRNEAPHQDVMVVELRDVDGSPFANGSEVALTAGKSVMRRWIGGGSYQSVDAPAAYFGLAAGGKEEARVLRVRWPDGKTAELGQLPVNRRIVVRRGEKAVRAFPLPGRIEPDQGCQR